MNKKMKENKKEIIELINSTGRKGIENLVSWMEGSDFFVAPASTMFHGNYPGGLAEHSYEVYKGFKRQVKHYGLNVPEDSQIISGICHDICKTNYYTENRLKSGNLSESKPYKVKDNFPFGHGEKSVIYTQRHIDLTEQEAMLIRWHMGASDPSWEDYCEKIEKQFPEVILFHNVDKEVSMIRNI